MNSVELGLEGLDCASCADKIEKRVNQIDGVSEVVLDFINKKLKFNISEDKDSEIAIKEIQDIVYRLEPGVIVNELGKSKKAHRDHEDLDEHGHDHGDVQDKDLIKIVTALILFSLPFLFKIQGNLRFAIYFTSYIIVGYEVIIRAFRNVFAGVPFDENFLMTIATVGAFIIGEYPEGVAVMLFYQVGEFFQGKAVNHSRRSIKALMDIKPDYANLVKGDEIVVVDPLDVHIGDYIIIRPGEKVPLDGVVVQGSSSLDTSNITGESVPRKVKEGEKILSGVINGEGLIRVLVEKEFGESTISKILDLVENASSKKAPTENFITKFARYYTPVVVFIALAIGIIPPLFFNGIWTEWAYRSFVFLVISCPCALVISIPLGFFGGIGAASKQGILIKGGNFLEALNDVDTIVMDKTGTITKGTFEVTDIFSYGDYIQEEILEIAALGEAHSSHPIARAIINKYNRELKEEDIQEYKDISGKGISALIKDKRVLLGNEKLMDEYNVEIVELQRMGTIVYIASEGEHIGSIIVSDELKDNIQEDIKDLKAVGIHHFVMLSGDNKKTTEEVGELLGIEKVYGELLPEDKVNIFEKILKTKKGKEKVIFVGDGVNDSPALARADIGIAMGALGSDAAIEAADIVIMTDEIKKITTSIKIAHKTKRIVTQNIAIAIGLKLVVLGLGAIGLATMWQAVFADVGVSIIAILNSIRVLKVEE